ncbi:recombinase [Streptococcus iniae]|uniref:ERF family protein n=1 Tax=Streptococcus iniae TaxID=1346 RepID=UPI000EF6972F|nr:ERF family protein [Streptococcus iniae]RLU51586.1 recombinase [Streptococcus iniae]RLU58544.1 recombinase [Streptococcus iniae]RLU60536.1 recombinase [Streptococcus iniae]RLU68696.1 recombinase [Streptococcus iniae]RLU82686.1 recombinase [Streptococcus iniae]
MTVYKKLLSVQSELKAPKSQYNSFGKYAYRNAEDIKEAVKPLLVKYEATLIIDINILEVGNGWIFEEAVAKFVDVETGESVQAKGYAREATDKKGMDVSQISGSTNSYAAKYAMNGLFLLDDTKDADSEEYHKQNNKQQATKPTAKKIDGALVTGYKSAIKNVIEKTGKNDGSIMRWFLEHLQVAKIEDITTDKVDTANTLIEKLQGGK